MAQCRPVRGAKQVVVRLGNELDRFRLSNNNENFAGYIYEGVGRSFNILGLSLPKATFDLILPKVLRPCNTSGNTINVYFLSRTLPSILSIVISPFYCIAWTRSNGFRYISASVCFYLGSVIFERPPAKRGPSPR